MIKASKRTSSQFAGYVGPAIGDERICMLECGCLGAYRRVPRVHLREKVLKCEDYLNIRFMNPHALYSVVMATYLNDEVDEPIRWQ